MDLSNRIKLLRQKHKLTQGQLAEVLGLQSTAISNYESTRNEPSIEKLIALADYFNVSCDYLLGLTDIDTRVNVNTFDKEFIESFKKVKKLRREYQIELYNYLQYLLYFQENHNELLYNQENQNELLNSQENKNDKNKND